MLKHNLPLVAQELDTTCAAACFESVYRYFENSSLGEIHFSTLLKTLELGFTPPENVAALALKYGWKSELKEGAELLDLVSAMSDGLVVFITWWDEDAGHYSLINELGENYIVLMDPWLARENIFNKIEIESFLKYWKLRGNKMISVWK